MAANNVRGKAWNVLTFMGRFLGAISYHPVVDIVKPPLKQTWMPKIAIYLKGDTSLKTNIFAI